MLHEYLPQEVTASGSDVIVKVGNLRTPLHEESFKALGLHKPKSNLEAEQIALRLKKNHTPIPMTFKLGNQISLNKMKKMYRGRYKGGLPPEKRKEMMKKREDRRSGKMKGEITELVWIEGEKQKSRTELSEIAKKHGIALLDYKRKDAKMEIKIGSEKADQPSTVDKNTQKIYVCLEEMTFDPKLAEVKWSD